MFMKPRALLASLGLASLPFAASAQDIELVTEAPITFQLVFGTNHTTTNGQIGATRRDVTRSYSSIVGNPQILEALRTSGLIEDPTTAGWQLRAVRSAPADLNEVGTSFFLYVVKPQSDGDGTDTSVRMRVPSAFFASSSFYSAEQAVTRHSTRNIISSSGSVTNYAEMRLQPTFVRKEVPPVITGPFSEPFGAGTRSYNLSTKTETTFTLDSQRASGFSNVTFATKNDPVFYYAINLLRYDGRGDFTGTLVDISTGTKKYTTRGVPDEILEPEISAEAAASGLVSFRMTIGTASLVEQSKYPEVSY